VGFFLKRFGLKNDLKLKIKKIACEETQAKSLKILGFELLNLKSILTSPNKFLKFYSKIIFKMKLKKFLSLKNSKKISSNTQQLNHFLSPQSQQTHPIRECHTREIFFKLLLSLFTVLFLITLFNLLDSTRRSRFLCRRASERRDIQMNVLRINSEASEREAFASHYELKIIIVEGEEEEERSERANVRG
jgi:hypothetical protein